MTFRRSARPRSRGTVAGALERVAVAVAAVAVAAVAVAAVAVAAVAVAVACGPSTRFPGRRASAPVR
ncbi:hypothetical protein MO973_34420 [Paenibacillus sp. TRM 82003]|uniref:hypothetical protein n=1 Tax=Kineococcus sp. TRM81007 TaxID=2925831 RepID=UPI001F5A383E|nr:hypothetical protein [Kineococcus sp. TRM81007]MCI2237199.1 hypothetical protein [Kineococcus sp. TRM81007]MCI3925319.1 hypothetical protein [Paenibacillus sp. TRM 82003]